ncbi:thiamine phosphate synthase [Legionella saoudiensis]|uniref:thiamine phosphate synthase n=1 Tax=Legionella saoudiensis TaxID=1750561 RepID=UPI0007314C2D|nr:thiamine phosphate synthase [Legionella saoudiensis]
MKTIRVITGSTADVLTVQGLGLTFAKRNVIPDAIKIGASTSADEAVQALHTLDQYPGFVVVDCSLPLQSIQKTGSKIDLWILKVHEVELLLNCIINSQEACEKAAAQLLAFGVNSVLIKGEQQREPLWVHDYWSNGTRSFWLTQRRYAEANYSGAGTTFSTAITSALVLGYPLEDALVIAKMYVNQAIRLAKTELYYGGFPEAELDLPYIASSPLHAAPQPFKPAHYLGLYPVVDSADWVEALLKMGVKTVQLRIKERTDSLEDEMKRSITLAKEHQATLFINDHWDMALKLGAEAIHLGQADLETADLQTIQAKGLLLGVSTYCYHEVARAHAINPSYIAIGPVYPTQSKDLEYAAQGIENLLRWKRTLSYPLVAIGGINQERITEVAATGVSGVALISAITQAANPQLAVKQLLACV